MDRRQRKTREAIFNAFTELLHKKDYAHITVGDIIGLADVGRATFYAHFETKDHLLSEMCGELFCHLFDSMNGDSNGHRHIFACDAPSSVFLHLYRHLQKNDNSILKLMTGRNNELFLTYFKKHLNQLVESQLYLFDGIKSERLPESLWVSHISSTFISILSWWTENGMKESAEVITEYFFLTLGAVRLGCDGEVL